MQRSIQQELHEGKSKGRAVVKKEVAHLKAIYGCSMSYFSIIQELKGKLQKQVVSDLRDIGQLSLGAANVKDIECCPPESENFVTCFNVSENLDLGLSKGEEVDRHYGPGSRQNCLVLPPTNYKIPLRWPTSRDVIWHANVNITAQEVLSSGSLTKSLMLLEEKQIFFRSNSTMFDSIEDYSHQIVEMIGLRNE